MAEPWVNAQRLIVFLRLVAAEGRSGKLLGVLGESCMADLNTLWTIHEGQVGLL